MHFFNELVETNLSKNAPCQISPAAKVSFGLIFVAGILIKTLSFK